MTGDGVLVVDNKVIYDSVIDPINNKRFHHYVGDPKVQEFNETNYYKAMLEPSGNLIGELAINGAKISNSCQVGTKDEMKQKYYDNMKYLMYLAEIEMEVIDAPKIMILRDKRTLLEPIKVFSEKPKPRFLMHRQYYNWKEKGDYNNSAVSEMDKYFDYINDNLLKDKYCTYRKNNETKGNKILHKYMKSTNIDDSKVTECKKLIANMASKEDSERNRIDVLVNNEFNVLKKDNPKLKDYYKTYMKKAKYKEIIYKYLKMAYNIESKYDYSVVCNALVALNKTDTFIIKFFFNSLQLKLLENKEHNKSYMLAKDPEGEIIKFGEKFKRVTVKLEPINIQAEMLERARKHYKEKKECSIKNKLLNVVAEMSISLMPNIDDFDKRIQLFNEWVGSNKQAEIRTEIYKGRETTCLYFNGEKMCCVLGGIATDNDKKQYIVADFESIKYLGTIDAYKNSVKIKILL